MLLLSKRLSSHASMYEYPDDYAKEGWKSVDSFPTHAELLRVRVMLSWESSLEILPLSYNISASVDDSIHVGIIINFSNTSHWIRLQAYLAQRIAVKVAFY